MKNPRIYLYKVTFEEVPYWYWGIHKEKVFGEVYLGSPVTNAWAWEFYTPLVQICQEFPPTEEGWKQAQFLEKRNIRPDLNNPDCLNEHCGGEFSLQILREAGRKGGKKAAEKLHAEKDEFGRSVQGVKSAEKLNAEKDEQGRGIVGVKVAEKLHAEKDELGRSIHSVKAFESVHKEKDDSGKSIHAVRSGAKGGAKAHEEKNESGKSVLGVKNAEKMLAVIHKEKDDLGRSVQGVKNAERANNQVWESTIDGFRSTAAGVVSYHKGKGWDPNARRRVS
jgi:hypothetical protein